MSIVVIGLCVVLIQTIASLALFNFFDSRFWNNSKKSGGENSESEFAGFTLGLLLGFGVNALAAVFLVGAVIAKLF